MHFLNYKDQELPLTIDFKVVKNVTSKLGIKLSQFEQSIDNVEHNEVIAYEALKRGHELEKKEFNIQPEEVVEILSNSYADFLVAFTADVLKMFTIKKK